MKDYSNPFRSITYRNSCERNIVLGSVEDNSFIKESKQITEDLIRKVNSVRVK